MRRSIMVPYQLLDSTILAVIEARLTKGKVNAIKVLRERIGCDLRSAKDWVDGLDAAMLLATDSYTRSLDSLEIQRRADMFLGPRELNPNLGDLLRSKLDKEDF